MSMFEYIKRVSLAVKLLAKKIEVKNKSLSTLLFKESLDILEMSQRFRTDNYDAQEVYELHKKILFLVDVVDYARVDNSVSAMNAKVFISALSSFSKHIEQLITTDTYLDSALNDLENDSQTLAETLARKSAKTEQQNKFFSYSLDTADSSVSDSGTDSLQPQPKQLGSQGNQQLNEEVTVEPKSDMDIRRGRIVSELKKGGGSIKDIGTKLGDINEKTLQRDLLELMRERKVIMLGKKRWAKYYLK